MYRTPLFDIHKKLNGKLVEFGGWEMPLYYSGVVAEHIGVRENVGLFDICHMGRLTVNGPDSESFLQKVTVNNVAALIPGRAQYSLICNPEGGVKDDIFIYKKGDGNYLICVNASNREKIYQWFLAQSKKENVTIEDASSKLGMLALQGPKAPQLLERVLGQKYRKLKHAEFYEEEMAGTPVMIARTGYTGEVMSFIFRFNLLRNFGSFSLDSVKKRGLFQWVWEPETPCGLKWDMPFTGMN
jgi:glycine cleavage system T protein (aminomethyltransferase)